MSHDPEQLHDLIIVGGGPSGIMTVLNTTTLAIS